MERSYESLSTAIEALTKEGFTIDFNLVDEGIESKALKERWTASQCEVVRFFRFEGMSSTDDSSILYAIKTKDGKKGVLVDAYGVYSGNVSEEMMQKLRVH